MNISKYKLRGYQIDATNAAIKGLQIEKKPFIIQAATGAGKSLIIAEICHQINEPILILQPSKEILEQNYQKLLSYDPDIDAGIYSASKGRKEIKKFTFATIGSIYKKPDEFKHFQYVVIDECHGVNPKNLNGMLTSFLRKIECTKVCGLTATPYRIDQIYSRTPWGDLMATASLKMINRISRQPFFKKILYKIETADLIEQGYLANIEYFVDSVELDELVVNTTGADFTTESLDKFWNQKRLGRIAAAVAYSEKNNTRSLVFCSSLRQANNAKMMVRELGIGAEMVSGKTPLRERERIIAEYRAGKIKHLFNVGVFTTGFDVPELDCIVLARPTMSLALYYQMIGRGVRIDPARPSKVLQVYDLVGVVERLGRVETIRVQTEQGGFRDEVWSERGRMDNTELYQFKIKPKEKSYV
jgi:DNA repair protein RadD